jgi:hypothetical protein
MESYQFGRSAIKARHPFIAENQRVVYNLKFKGGSNSVVECDLAKVEVAGSNPVSRSNVLLASPFHISPFLLHPR